MSSKGSLLCKKKGCQTQWVHDFLIQYLTLLTLIFSTIYNVYLWSRHLNIGFAQPVVSLCKDEGGSTSEDDVILLYLDRCLIMWLVSPLKVQEKKKKSTPGLFFKSWCPLVYTPSHCTSGYGHAFKFIYWAWHHLYISIAEWRSSGALVVGGSWGIFGQ